jgi:hypothetical protein
MVLAFTLTLLGLLIANPSWIEAHWWKKHLGLCAAPTGYYNGSIDGEDYSIGAFSKDFKKCMMNPVLEPIEGTWERRHVKDPYAIRQGERVYLYYAATNGIGGGYHIGLATTTNGLHFNRYEDNPLLKGSFPVVSVRDGLWTMYYSREPNPGLYYATSTNGFDWKEQGLLLDVENRVLISGDILGTRLYFGERRKDHPGRVDVLRYVDLTTKEVSEVLLDLSPCSVTPRGIVNENLMYVTIFGCVVGIQETVAEFKDGEIVRIGLLGTPEPDLPIWRKKWDAVSAENITWIR